MNDNNGHSTTNGNSNGFPKKVFTLQPATDDLTFTILDLRRRILQWQKRRKGRPGLGTGDKHFACHLIDLACNKNFNERYGVVIASEASLARDLGVSERTIHSWKRNICQTGEFWMSKKYRPNMWPADVYHISVLDPQKPDYQPTKDGMYGAGGTRSVPKAGMGARTPGKPGLSLPGSKSRPALPEAENAETPIIAAEGRKSLRLSAEENCGSEPKKSAAESRRNLRLRAEENCGSEPKESAAESGSKLRLSAEANCVLKRVSVKSNETIELKGKGTPPENGFDAWIKTLNNSLPSRLERIRDELAVKVRTSKSDSARAEWQRRLEIVSERIHGPAVIDAPAPRLKPKTAAIIERKPTFDEILSGAQYLVSVGKAESLTAEQRDALKSLPLTPSTKTKITTSEER